MHSWCVESEKWVEIFFHHWTSEKIHFLYFFLHKSWIWQTLGHVTKKISYRHFHNASKESRIYAGKSTKRRFSLMSNDEKKIQPIFQILHIKSAWFLLELAMALVTTIGMRFLQVWHMYLQDETSAKWEMVENGLPDNESPFRLLVWLFSEKVENELVLLLFYSLFFSAFQSQDSRVLQEIKEKSCRTLKIISFYS